ncbi:MAG: hypothetical protein U0X91_26995 [Spirosomataceae bacterium]
MKPVLLVSLLILLRLSTAAQEFSTASVEKKIYNYFIPERKVADSGTRIEVNDKGDTVLVATYSAINVSNRTANDFSKVYKGTPFFKNGWYKGKVATEKGGEVNVVMAYNVQNGKIYIVVDPEKEASELTPPAFYMEGHLFKRLKNQYFEPLYEGESVLLKQYACMLKPHLSGQRTGYESEDSEYEGEFLKSSGYYLWVNNKLKTIPAGKKLFHLFGAYRSEMENYMQQQGLNVAVERDLVAVFKYYDSLTPL